MASPTTEPKPKPPTPVERLDAIVARVNAARQVTASHGDVDRLNAIHADLLELRVALTAH